METMRTDAPSEQPAAEPSGTAPDAEPDRDAILEETPPPGLLRRFFTIARHLGGLVFGGAAGLRPRAARRPGAQAGACASPRCAW